MTTNGPSGALLEDGPEAEMADAEMFADLFRDAVLTHFDGVVRPVHRVAVGRLLRGGAALTLLVALDAVREMAARGESRDVCRKAFIHALSDVDPPRISESLSADELAAEEAAAAAHAGEVGPDAFLLERMAVDREALAVDAAGIDEVVARQARTDTSSLRTLALRHGVHHARRDVARRPPYVPESAMADLGRKVTGT